jgi:hypothetical protein
MHNPLIHIDFIRQNSTLTLTVSFAGFVQGSQMIIFELILTTLLGSSIFLQLRQLTQP